MKEIDKIDSAILQNLLEDGRTKFTTIAKECSVSTDTIWKRYQEMKKEGKIVGETIYYNYTFFGYSAIANLLINVDTQFINELIENLRQFANIDVCRQYNSPFNVMTVNFSKNLKELDRIRQIICKDIMINEVKTLLWTDVRNTSVNILRTPFEYSNDKQAESQLRRPQLNHYDQICDLKLDKVDNKIIDKLTDKSRMPFKTIGQEIGVSTDTVINRYKKLVKNNIIKTTIQINPEKLGYHALLTFLLAVRDHSETKLIAEKLSEIPRISYVTILTGDFDIRAVALVKDVKEIYAVYEQIENIPNIRKVQMTIRHPRLWPPKRQYITTF
jgi:Lrp/AsnC family transcriptional regulator, regulator for asnA, asnC and gidA